MRIGRLASATQTAPSTIRYYEQIGLLQPASRQSGNQRVYDEEDVRRLNFIRRIREFRFSIDNVRLMIGLAENPQGACTKTRAIASMHLKEVRERLAELTELEQVLTTLVNACDQSLSSGEPSSCVLLDGLESEALAE